MFPTRVPAWRTQPRIGGTPVGGTASYDLGNPVARRIAALSALAVQHPALRDGAQITRFTGSGGAAGVFAVSRIDAARRIEYVVAFNNGATARTVPVPTSSPRTTFATLWPAVGSGSRSDGAGAPPAHRSCPRRRRPARDPCSAPRPRNQRHSRVARLRRRCRRVPPPGERPRPGPRNRHVRLPVQRNEGVGAARNRRRPAVPARARARPVHEGSPDLDRRDRAQLVRCRRRLGAPDADAPLGARWVSAGPRAGTRWLPLPLDAVPGRTPSARAARARRGGRACRRNGLGGSRGIVVRQGTRGGPQRHPGGGGGPLHHVGRAAAEPRVRVRPRHHRPAEEPNPGGRSPRGRR